MRRIERAIVLAAGRGRRLDEMTNSCPKSLLKVGPLSILERTLGCLARHGIEQTVLVVGYRAGDIMSLMGNRVGQMSLDYVENTRFAETGTSYSLWTARKYLQGDCLLLEGDLVFDDSVLKRVLTANAPSVWAAISVVQGRDDGILLTTDGSSRLVDIRLVRRSDRLAPIISGFPYKCAGIQMLSADLVNRLRIGLEDAVYSGHLGIYADEVLGRFLKTTEVHLCLLDDLRWAEVDDLQDLYNARDLFGEHV